jgi:hypothetical protein
MKCSLTLCVFLLCIQIASAQEMWGISNSNYSGNMGIFLNPSTIVGAPYRYEINIVAADIFAENNYIYFPRNRNIVLNSLQGKGSEDKADRDIFTNTSVYGFGKVLLIGPSYINSTKDDHAWGVHTAYRAEISAPNVPAPVAKYIYEEYDYPPFLNRRFSSPSFAAAILNWYEIGGTYGKVLYQTEFNYLKGAATVNALLGTNGSYFDVNKMDYTVVDSSSILMHSMDMTMAHTLVPNDFNSLFTIRGMGASTTLGLTFMHKRKKSGFECDGGADHIKKYDYRIGFSAIDFGFVRFFKNKSQVTTVKSNSDHLISRIDQVPFNSLSAIDNTLTSTLDGDSKTEKKAFSMYLPAALSLQFDYSITNNWFANASIANRVYFSHKEIARGNSIALSTRYEKRKWEVDGDVSFFEYQRMSAGIGVRFWILVLGTDRLLEWVNSRDVQTFDFFFGFKWNGCDLPWKSKKACAAYAE